MIRLIRELARSYRGSRLVILLAMLLETAMSFATPWQLEVIIDNVVGPPQDVTWLADIFRPWMDDKHQLNMAVVAAGRLRSNWLAAGGSRESMAGLTRPMLAFDISVTRAKEYGPLVPPGAERVGRERGCSPSLKRAA